MKKLRESKAMQDDLISCMTILGYGIFIVPNRSKLEPWHRGIMAMGVVLFIAALALRLWRLRRNDRMTPEEQREAKRENSDERSRMIVDKATKYCWNIEDGLLLVGLVVFVFWNRPAVYSVLYAVLTVRVLVCTTIRWWLERKY